MWKKFGNTNLFLYFWFMKEIQLTRDKVTIVDDEDYERINQFKWYATLGANTFYANRKDVASMALHRFILDPLKLNPLQIDHINGDGLDNRRCNLRFATNQQNCMNVAPKHKIKSSIYKGVIKTRNNNFNIQFKLDYKSYSLGRVQDEILAAKYYDAVARYYHGEYAWCNFKEIHIQPDSIENIKLELKQRFQKKLIVKENDVIIQTFDRIKDLTSEIGLSKSQIYKIIKNKLVKNNKTIEWHII